jgi:hypothetical protein
VFVEHTSGVLAKRPALDDALDYLRSGDTLVVTKLDLALPPLNPCPLTGGKANAREAK